MFAAEATSGAEALALIRSHTPAVAVLDMNMPGMNGVEVARELQTAELSTAPVFLTMHKDEETFAAAMQAGVRGYVVKDNAVMDVVDCIRAVAAGDAYISPALSRFLVNRRSAKSPGIPGPDTLTPSERRVIQLIAQYIRPAKRLLSS